MPNKPSNSPDGASEMPPALLQLIRDARNPPLSETVLTSLRAFAAIFGVVRIDESEVPVLKPNLGFMPTGTFEEFMDFDHLVESAGLRKYVRTRFTEEGPFTSQYVCVTVLRPGVRGREAATIFELDQN